MKQSFLVAFLQLLLGVAAFWSCQPSKADSKVEASKPNIILFVADDHGLDALGCYGNPVIETPNLDKMAAEGVRFTNAYCTSASCAASRSVILSGKFGHATGSYGHTHDYHHFSTYDNVLSLPVRLEQAGYATARIGKYHLAPEKVYHFQTVIPANARNTLEMANKCQGVIDSEKPFFLYFCTDDPHRSAPFKPKNWDEPNRFGNIDGGYPGEVKKVYDPKEVLVPDFMPNTKQSREEIAEYYQSISRIDQGFGKLMGMLDKAGKLDNTIVIYISDNGMAFPGAKTTLYEPGMKLPCIIRDPSIKAKGILNQAMVSWVDLTPTILDMADVSYKKEEFHGHSFNAVIGQENPKGWDMIHASHTFHEITMYYPMRVVRKGDMKLIWNVAYKLEYPFASDLWVASTWQSIYRDHQPYYGPRKVEDYLYRAEFELYDLKKDPLEVSNLALLPEYKETLENMQVQMKTFQLNTQDPWLIMWDHDNSLQGTGVGL